jgi:hypothetical protein
MKYSGSERRKHLRINNAHFVVSYRIFQESDNIDVSQTKNLSLGGMLLTTNKEFQPGTNLALEIRLPFDPNPIILVGKVLDSRQIIKDLLYDTRLEFLAVDENHRKIITKTVEHYLKKG